MRTTVLGMILVLALLQTAAAEEEEIRMVSGANLSPDGDLLAFSWRGDLWTVSSEGGIARRLTTHPADDSEPHFSPDGARIAFTSDRFPGGQVFVMPADGGTPRQITFDTNGYSLQGWFPDGRNVLVRGRSDRFWVDDYRFYRVSTVERRAPEMLFDACGVVADLSPGGGRILFTREGVAWWRKGYTGSQAGQIWMHDLETGETSPILRTSGGSRWPLWLTGRSEAGDEGVFLYVGSESGSFNLMAHYLNRGGAGPVPPSGPTEQLTSFRDDSVVAPTVSRNGRLVVFRHLFDLYRLRLHEQGEQPVKLRITASADDATPERERRELRAASAAAFTDDGLEIALTAGGDLWVMDTVLREPVRVAATPEEEREPVFGPGGKSILFVSEQGGQSDLWRAERTEEAEYWWRNEAFRLTRITDDPAPESNLGVSPDGERIAFVRGMGTLVVANLDGTDAKVIVDAATSPDYDWSPDGRWLVFSYDDPNSNRDIWIAPVDGSAPAVNVSRHPYDDYGPAWSPDGRILAYLGSRRGGETDIFYVYLREADEEETKRERTLGEAIAKMKKGRKEPVKPGPKDASAKPAGEGAKEEKAPPPDLDTLHERVRRISTRGVGEARLFWSPEGGKLAFSSSVAGRSGIYTVSFPDDLGPKLLTPTSGSSPRWVKSGNQILWLVRGVPASSVGARTTTYPFLARTVVDLRAHQRVAFDMAWETMRDMFYDPAMNNRDWNAVREKYREVAAAAPDRGNFARIVSLMLGELNASHLGFSSRGGSGWRSPDQWTEVTGHLGVRFAPDREGPGLKVAEVVRGGPADRADGGLEAGDTILEVDGVAVSPAMDMTEILNGPAGREVRLTVAGADGKSRQVPLRLTDLSTVRRSLGYRNWLRETKRKVAELSDGELGYVHVRGMEWSSFEDFEKAVYSEGSGRKGLIIDVRWNSGGFTADHLLTVLFQPEHAVTRRRDAEPGYPQDRLVYARWTRPVVVLVNQDSFSNAEIFAHAVKTLGRGKIVGAPSAGGVISTSARGILDMGTIRVPLRGWFVIDTGEDMERSGVVPDQVLWPEPGELASGRDRQLEKAVEVLLSEVKAWESRPKPKLRKASER